MTEYHQLPNDGEALLLIERLVQFAGQRGLTEPLDVLYSRNALLDLFGFTEAYDGEVPEERLESAIGLLEPLLSYGASIGLIADNTTTFRDLLDARIMGLLMPRPAEAAARFDRQAVSEGIISATDAFYRLSIDSNYIRMDRIRKNQYWKHATEFGELEITVNLSKPEKDPREIALLRTMGPSNYPKCLLCAENIGYAGRADHPARQNLRVVPLELKGEEWYFQYSPYVYYNEHSIVFNSRHVPMRITHETFARLLDFVDAFPHYFIGSNADLPIVGGSILNHDHFQAGRHVFPMAQAEVERCFTDPSVKGLSFGIVVWPMSVIRINGGHKGEVLEAAGKILDAWRAYSDPQAEVFAFSDVNDEQVPHNTITPIARLRDNGMYELDLVLRNNRTSQMHPDGIFHPHQELHHIKKENIGLIEVMGLAILPGRLKSELEDIAALLTGAAAYDKSAIEGGPLGKHSMWIEELLAAHGSKWTTDEAVELLQSEVGRKFKEVLNDSGVFKRSEEGQRSFDKFLLSLGLEAAGQGRQT
ncbi:UDP-glucose--hexose-1-phosphate uridylyltransferase [Paenibacillus nasutitermitis]|uniref:Galactose-1-phosphate uridylyltransferase n=1 Tax=Paenibacillus nasutitermitis TaxID=1652958 RepID=A0A916Z4I2_9BACL|nr:UDP-glucose--hexose-1-phosphate uridylyltransferase [Paenibacillus nasutitermitis]GGD75843.1 galactose-1-phosphate uridylyltransferase [Paenibacillus nasutitermitis]